MGKKSIQDVLAFKIASYLANIVLLNILFLVCSIPIITIGASYTSMIAVARKIFNKDTLIFKSFFTSFKENFKQSTLAWLIILIPILFLYVEFSIVVQINVEVPLIIYVCIGIPAIFILVYVTWLELQPAYFESTLKQQFKNAFLFMLRLVPQDIVILVFNIFPILNFIFDFKAFIFAWPVWLFIYNASVACLITRVIDIPLKRLGEKKIHQ